MFNSIQTDLYRRLEDFELDDPTHELGFTRHLMRNHGWTLIQAQRAICEYKKFAFLTVVADHQVVPSDRVDQVWHAHILLTQSYWEEFCPKVLGQNLHHHPTQGGKKQRAEFHILYTKTIASYRHFFGSPPTDIWSSPDRRFGVDLKMQRINISEHWVIPKFSLELHIRKALIVATIVISIAAGYLESAQAANVGMSLINFIQPEPIFGLSITIGIALRYWIQMPDRKQQKPELNIYQIARLAGGESRAVDLAIVKLVHQGYLRPNVLRHTLAVEKSLPADANRLEQLVIFQARTTPNLKDIRLASNYKGEIFLLEEQLRHQYLLMIGWQDLIGKSFPVCLGLPFLVLFFLVLFLLVVGGFFNSLSLPITWLIPVIPVKIINSIATIIVSLWFATIVITGCCFIPSGRTRWGNRILADIHKKHDIYDVSQRFVFNGYKSLSGGALDDLKQIYQYEEVESAAGCGC